MALTASNKIKDLGGPEALAIIQKYLPTFDPHDPAMKMALNVPLKVLCGFPQSNISKERAKEMFAELAAANIEE